MHYHDITRGWFISDLSTEYCETKQNNQWYLPSTCMYYTSIAWNNDIWESLPTKKKFLWLFQLIICHVTRNVMMWRNYTKIDIFTFEISNHFLKQKVIVDYENCIFWFIFFQNNVLIRFEWSNLSGKL